jgi:hypothetical protein
MVGTGEKSLASLGELMYLSFSWVEILELKKLQSLLLCHFVAHG